VKSFLLLAVLSILALASCATRPPEKRMEAEAQYEFKRIMREYVIAAGDATNELVRAELVEQAVQGFRLLRELYPDAQPWAAMALRYRANLHAERGERKEALATYAKVGVLYPDQDWEVIQAWRSAGDLLWTSGMRKESLDFYRDIVARFDTPGQPPMYETIVRIARDRIAEVEAP